MNAISDILSTKPFSAVEPQPEEPQPASPEEPTAQPLDIQAMKTTLHAMQDQIASMLRLLDGQTGAPAPRRSVDVASTQSLPTGETIIEGVFDGQQMVGSDGKPYSVPPNYASKSKLVEGDLMKLTITNSGAFLYKQIGPIARTRLTGELVNLGGGKWGVQVNGKTYNVLTASVTFYKATAGDDVAILVPEDGQSGWGAVDNVLGKGA